MVWRIEISSLAQKNLDQLDPPIVRRILAFLDERVAPLEDPYPDRTHRQPSRGVPLNDYFHAVPVHRIQNPCLLQRGGVPIQQMARLLM